MEEIEKVKATEETQQAICQEAPKVSLWQRLRTKVGETWDNHGRAPINEGMRIQDKWYEEAKAKTMTLKTLPNFLKKLSRNYNHDYGTICHALAAAALAAAHAMNRTSQGGITGFQSGAVMWEFIQEWGMNKRGKPLRLVDYSDMLYPQYDHHFARTISPYTWKYLKEEAQKHLNASAKSAHPDVIAHWQSIVDGKVPFGYEVKED